MSTGATGTRYHPVPHTNPATALANPVLLDLATAAPLGHELPSDATATLGR